MSQQEEQVQVESTQATSEVEETPEVQETPEVRISKKTGKPVRAANTYQKFMAEKLREKSEDGKRKYTMSEASSLWKEHKGLQQS